jgi:hypothetical protein
MKSFTLRKQTVADQKIRDATNHVARKTSARKTTTPDPSGRQTFVITSWKSAVCCIY